MHHRLIIKEEEQDGNEGKLKQNIGCAAQPHQIFTIPLCHQYGLHRSLTNRTRQMIPSVKNSSPQTLRTRPVTHRARVQLR